MFKYKISKYKILLLILVTLNTLPTTSYANGVLCWDRDVTLAMSSFTNNQNPRAAAESWFPKYIEITKKIVRWGNNPTNLNGSSKNVGKKIASAGIIRNGYMFRFKIDEDEGKAFVTLIPPGQYVKVQPVRYNKCKTLIDMPKTAVRPIKKEKSYIQRCNLTPKNIYNIQITLKNAGYYNGEIDGKFGQNTLNGIKKAKRFLGKNASNNECLNYADISLLESSIINKNSMPKKSKLTNYKELCEEIGFKPGTESFGNCVLKMMDKD